LNPIAQVGSYTSAMQPGMDAATAALHAINDPNRFNQANQGRGQQLAVADYYNNLLTGKTPSVAGMMTQQAQNNAVGAIRAQALTDQGGQAPGLVARNADTAAANAQQGIAGQGLTASLQEQQNALNASAAAANALRGQDLSQTFGLSGEQLAGAGLLGNLGATSAGLSQAADRSNQANQTQRYGIDTTASLGREQLAQNQNQFQQNFDVANSAWNRYILPALGAGATLGGAALAGPLGGAAGAAITRGASALTSPGTGGSTLTQLYPGTYGGFVGASPDNSGSAANTGDEEPQEPTD
jgi:hypothetical protein